MKRILVTGAYGQLGRSLQYLIDGQNLLGFTFTDADTLDITSLEAINEACKGQDVIVNCAAYTNVDAAEDDLEKARLLNAQAVKNLADAARENGALLIHISTDYVFGGQMQNLPCSEDVKPCPTGVYGLTKHEGEQEIINSGCRYVIIRTAWLYSEYGRNFVLTMLRLMDERPELKVVVDQVGTPTYAHDLAQAILRIIFTRDIKTGIYNFSNQGVCSWYDFAQAIARLSQNETCTISPCRSSEFPSKVVRPAYSVLDKTKIIHTFGVNVPYWIDSLKHCIDNIYGKA